jgi:hypothetical protein
LAAKVFYPMAGSFGPRILGNGLLYSRSGRWKRIKIVIREDNSLGGRSWSGVGLQADYALGWWKINK